MTVRIKSEEEKIIEVIATELRKISEVDGDSFTITPANVEIADPLSWGTVILGRPPAIRVGLLSGFVSRSDAEDRNQVSKSMQIDFCILPKGKGAGIALERAGMDIARRIARLPWQLGDSTFPTRSKLTGIRTDEHDYDLDIPVSRIVFQFAWKYDDRLEVAQEQ